jgi:hypothetical protein
LIIAISPLIHVLLKIRSMLRYASWVRLLNEMFIWPWWHTLGIMEYKNELEDRSGGLATANMHWERSLNVVFPPCQLRTIRCMARLCFETLQLASCLG